VEALPDTRQRLLLAAGEVFAERGFRAATVRDIVERAGANVAAVNYHFRDKERLYDEVLAWCCRGAAEWLPALADDLAPMPQRLRAFVGSFLDRCLGTQEPAWHWQLLAREMAEPTPALNTLVERVMRPTYERLVPIVQGLTEGRLTEQAAWLCAQSIIAQCVHQKHAQSIIQRLGEPLPLGDNRAEVLAEHIFRFSLAAIEHYARADDPINVKSRGRTAPART